VNQRCKWKMDRQTCEATYLILSTVASSDNCTDQSINSIKPMKVFFSTTRLTFSNIYSSNQQLFITYLHHTHVNSPLYYHSMRFQASKKLPVKWIHWYDVSYCLYNFRCKSLQYTVKKMPFIVIKHSRIPRHTVTHVQMENFPGTNMLNMYS